MLRVGINGFGRIGRLSFRVGLLKHANQLEFTAINTSGSMDVGSWAHLANYDTMYGKFEYEVKAEKIKDPATRSTGHSTLRGEPSGRSTVSSDRIGSDSKSSGRDSDDPLIGYLLISEKGLKTPVLAERDPSRIPWGKYKVDVVIESTGVFTKEEDAKKHALGGAKRVVLSAPAKGGNIGTYVLGVNEVPSASSGQVKGIEVISNASCTTNCVAPVAAVLHSKFGIEAAMMTTVHGYTDDQNLQDGSHKDLRRARAAALNIVPTSTGAAIATTETIPELKGIFDGMALRVPVATGSISDVTALIKRKVTVEDVNGAFVEASQNALYRGILAVSTEPLVSSDIIGRSESAIVDLPLTQVVGGNLVKVFAWYDNEWGYANRLIEQVIRVGERLDSLNAPKDPITLSFGK